MVARRSSLVVVDVSAFRRWRLVVDVGALVRWSSRVSLVGSLVAFVELRSSLVDVGSLVGRIGGVGCVGWFVGWLRWLVGWSR